MPAISRRTIAATDNASFWSCENLSSTLQMVGFLFKTNRLTAKCDFSAHISDQSANHSPILTTQSKTRECCLIQVKVNDSNCPDFVVCGFKV